MHLFRSYVVVAFFVLWTTGANAAGEGYVAFLANASTVWENFSTGSFQRSAQTVKVTFFWGASNSVPAVDSLLTFTPTNSVYGGPPPWSTILNDPTFTEAIDASTGLPAIANTSLFGSFNYGLFPLVGTIPATTYTVYVIGWDADYATPQAAAAAGSPVGWSNPIQYITVNLPLVGLPFTTAGLKPFGVNVPEPSACGLIVFGAATLLGARRRG